MVGWNGRRIELCFIFCVLIELNGVEWICDNNVMYFGVDVCGLIKVIVR